MIELSTDGTDQGSGQPRNREGYQSPIPAVSMSSAAADAGGGSGAAASVGCVISMSCPVGSIAATGTDTGTEQQRPRGRRCTLLPGRDRGPVPVNLTLKLPEPPRMIGASADGSGDMGAVGASLACGRVRGMGPAGLTGGTAAKAQRVRKAAVSASRLHRLYLWEQACCMTALPLDPLIATFLESRCATSGCVTP